MRIISSLLLLLCFASCTPTLTEMWVNKDGSGRAESTIDIGEMMGMFAGMMESESPTASDDKKKTVMDSTMNFYDIMPDSIKQADPNAILLKNMAMHMHLDQEQNIGTIMIGMDYKDGAELEKMFKVLADAKSDEGGGSPMMGMAGEGDLSSMFLKADTDLKNGIIRVPVMDMMAELEKEGMMDQDVEFMSMMDSLEHMDENSEEYQMMQMMFGKDTKTVIHCPGNVEFTNDPGAIINGKTVTFTDNMLEQIKSRGGGKEGVGERLIKFKK